MKSKLESEGISCFLFDENIVNLNPLYNMAVGGIKLKINRNNITAATETLNQCADAPLYDDKGELLKCPKCHSSDLYTGFKSMKGVKGVMSAIASFLLFAYPPYIKSVYRCKNCGREFKADS